MIGRPKAFTLIELMIVVALISVLTAIAIPNFLQSRMVANEIATISALRTIAEGQTIYKKTDWDGDAKFEYALPLHRLCQDGALITDRLAEAHLTGYPDGQPYIPDQGYIFYDNYSYEVSPDSGPAYFANVVDEAGNALSGFGAHAWPGSYNLTGRNCFAINDKGVVWQNDIDPVDPAEPNYNYYFLLLPTNMHASGWVVPN